jgi:hypothetical protein
LNAVLVVSNGIPRVVPPADAGRKPTNCAAAVSFDPPV